MAKKLYAEEINYWKTGQSSADTWIDKAKKEITAIAGKVTGEAYGSFDGSAAYILTFQISGDNFKITWPVLESKTKNEKAARIQAATFLYHDVKAKCMVAKVFGARKAFVGELLLSNGATVAEAAAPEMFRDLPRLLLVSGVVIEGEVVD